MSEGEEQETVETTRQPTSAAAVGAIETALDREHLVSIVGHCVEDGGEQPGGLRHVLVKPEGHVVVHGQAGADPDRRWTASGGLEVVQADGEVVVRPTEGGGNWQLALDHVESVTSFAAAGTAGATPDGQGGHTALRDRLLAAPDLVEPGFEPLATERATPAGPIDLYGRDAEGRAVVVEVKADRAGPAAVGQLDRYVEALAADLHADAEVRGVLVAPSATQRTRQLLDRRDYGFSRIATGE